jgi:8-oxo-dGTP diphosphatase
MSSTDWSIWQPRERGVLCFIQEDDNLLLIEKKRGLGAGKVNGPGGRIEAGETELQAAIRETEEEVGVTPLQVREIGRLHFDFRDGYSLHCTVFLANGFHGNLIETDEALPFWKQRDQVPYERMWQDDIHWFPFLLREEAFEGWFEFEGETMLSHRVTSKQKG